MLYEVITSRPFNWMYRWLHPDLGSRIANRASMTAHRGAPTEGETGLHVRERPGATQRDHRRDTARVTVVPQLV